MTCGRAESLSSSPTSFLSSHSTLSVSSSSNRTNAAYFPSDRMSLFIRSHLQSKKPPELPHKWSHRRVDWCMLLRAWKYMCLCIVYILCILDYKSKYLCEIVGGVSYWQITTGSAIMCLLDTLSNRQKIGLNICLLLRSFWCVNIDPAALIASDSDNKNRLSEKTFLKTSSWICTEKSEEWAQWKRKLSFCLNLFVNFLELWG